MICQGGYIKTTELLHNGEYQLSRHLLLRSGSTDLLTDSSEMGLLLSLAGFKNCPLGNNLIEFSTAIRQSQFIRRGNGVRLKRNC